MKKEDGIDMEKPSLNLIAEINALQRMRSRELHEKYDALIPELRTCKKCEILRAEIAYRLQERYYGISVPVQTMEKIRHIASKVMKRTDMPLSGTRLLRDWKGERHEVIVREDGIIEYRNGFYKSLSAVARKITGTNWNGRAFFGIKK